MVWGSSHIDLKVKKIILHYLQRLLKDLVVAVVKDFKFAPRNIYNLRVLGPKYPYFTPYSMVLGPKTQNPT